MLAGEHEDQLVLRPVGVLVLIHQQMPESMLIVGQQVRIRLQQVDRHEEEIVEIHGAGGKEAVLVLAVDLGHPPLVAGARLLGIPLEVDQLVLAGRDEPVDVSRRELLHVDAEVTEDVGHQPNGVGLVVNGEGRPVPEPGRVSAENPYARGMEGRDPHPLRHRAHQGRHPVAPLLGRLVGEGDGQDLERGYALLGDQPGDPVGEDPGLARARSGHDEQGTSRVGDRLGLHRVETGQQGRGSARSGRAGRAGRGGRGHPGHGTGRHRQRRRCQLPAEPAEPAEPENSPQNAEQTGKLFT